MHEDREYLGCVVRAEPEGGEVSERHDRPGVYHVDHDDVLVGVSLVKEDFYENCKDNHGDVGLKDVEDEVGKPVGQETDPRDHLHVLELELTFFDHG